MPTRLSTVLVSLLMLEKSNSEEHEMLWTDGTWRKRRTRAAKVWIIIDGILGWWVVFIFPFFLPLTYFRGSASVRSFWDLSYVINFKSLTCRVSFWFHCFILICVLYTQILFQVKHVSDCFGFLFTLGNVVIFPFNAYHSYLQNVSDKTLYLFGSACWCEPNGSRWFQVTELIKAVRWSWTLLHIRVFQSLAFYLFQFCDSLGSFSVNTELEWHVRN